MIPHTEHLEQLSAAVARIGTLAIAPEQPYAARGGAQPVAYIAVAHDDGTYSTHTAVLPPGRFPYVSPVSTVFRPLPTPWPTLNDATAIMAARATARCRLSVVGREAKGLFVFCRRDL